MDNNWDDDKTEDNLHQLKTVPPPLEEAPKVIAIHDNITIMYSHHWTTMTATMRKMSCCRPSEQGQGGFGGTQNNPMMNALILQF